MTQPESPATALTPAEALDTWLDRAMASARDGKSRLAQLDLSEEYPADMLTALDEFGLPAYYVPDRYGGRLDDHEQLLALWRALSRRDLSLAVAHGKTYLGGAPVWTSGTLEQASDLAADILGGVRVALALSEPDSGADLLSGRVTATRAAGGYQLDGVKWPVNNATRGRRLTVLAQTGNAGRARDYSLFLVDKSRLAPGSYRLLPKARTHGIRGADISGIEFRRAPVAAAALLGPEGTGLETVLRALQLTRTMCAALSLGAGEHALRLTARFTATRVIQERPLAARPHIRSVLARCAALLVAAEAATLTATRSAHSLTGELSVISAIVKGLVPTLADAMIAELSEVLGARSFLTEEYEHGAFQKIWRDHQIVAIFDGSTPVNRDALSRQFPRLVRGYRAGDADWDGLREAAAAGTRPRPLDHARLALLSRHGCSTVQSLPELATRIAGDAAPAGLVARTAALVKLAGELHRRMAGARPAAHPPASHYEWAAGYELVYAGAACLHLWRASTATAPATSGAAATRNAPRAAGWPAEPLWRDALWVRAALRELTSRLAVLLRCAPPAAAADDDEITGQLAGAVLAAAADGSAVTPFGLPGAAGDST
jgi:alkylation response protein AidB-like acyl-CoA dehydrogenase